MKFAYGYSASKAGETVLKNVVAKKEELRSRLVKPLEYLYVERKEYEAALAEYVEAKIAINRMDHAEVEKALKES